MSHKNKYIDDLNSFSQIFDMTYEDKAVTSRGQFLQFFPLNKLNHITLDDYVIGKGTASFCACVEAKTKSWANIQGATADKFGIYFGKTKSDPTMKYRFTKKFGSNQSEAFKNVKDALLDLVKSGSLQNFEDIDKNPLSQMFKAKILSLYFPDLYLNVCSSDHLEHLAIATGISEREFMSEYQHLLIDKKMNNRISKNWSNPKFMSFLYDNYFKADVKNRSSNVVKKPKKRTRHNRVNFDEILKNRDEIGKKSEIFAIEWEKNRLTGLGLDKLINKIKDRRDRPSYGYDFLSFSTPKRERHIEVKSVGKDPKEKCHRFYLSEHEFDISNSDENYYFYLVLYNREGEPYDVLARSAKDFYQNSDLIPCAYIARFDIEEHK